MKRAGSGRGERCREAGEHALPQTVLHFFMKHPVSHSTFPHIITGLLETEQYSRSPPTFLPLTAPHNCHSMYFSSLKPTNLQVSESIKTRASLAQMKTKFIKPSKTTPGFKDTLYPNYSHPEGATKLPGTSPVLSQVERHYKGGNKTSANTYHRHLTSSSRWGE